MLDQVQLEERSHLEQTVSLSPLDPYFATPGIPTTSSPELPFNVPFTAGQVIETFTPGSHDNVDVLRDSHRIDTSPTASGTTKHWHHTGELENVVQIIIHLQGQANALLNTYCTTFDPIYPILNTADLTKDHNRFWAMSLDERHSCDPVQLAKLLAVYACAAQQSPRSANRNTVEICLAACHRALCISQYLCLHSLQRCQVIFLICQCLINEGREKEAWTLAGLNQRQTTSLNLDFNQDNTTGDIPNEQWDRAQLWPALLHQDEVLSCILKVPRSMSGPVSHPTALINELQPDSVSSQATSDRWYCIALGNLADVMQTHHSNRDSSHSGLQERSDLRSLLQATFQSFEHPFRDLDCFWAEQQTDSRIARQGIELMCVFHFYMTLASDSDDGINANSTTSDLHRVIDSVHDGLAAFFSLEELPLDEKGSWSSCYTLSYIQAVWILSRSYRSRFIDVVCTDENRIPT